MKKIIAIFLIIFSFTLPVQAQTLHHGDRMSLKEFMDRVGVQGLRIINIKREEWTPINATLYQYECYKNTSEQNPKIEECIVADFILKKIFNLLKEKADVIGTIDPTTAYMENEVFEKRFSHYAKLPIFDDLRQKGGEEAIRQYFSKSADFFLNYMLPQI